MTTRINYPENIKDKWAEIYNGLSQLLSPRQSEDSQFAEGEKGKIGRVLSGLLMGGESPEEAAVSGAVGLGPGVITAIPKPFRSEWLDRVKKYAPSFPKKSTGAEILGQLESKGILPKGYGEYYGTINPPKSTVLIHPTPEEIATKRKFLQDLDMEYIKQGYDPTFGTTPEEFPDESVVRILRTKFGNPDIPALQDDFGRIQRDQLVPYLEENWVNPRIDVRSRSGQEFLKSDKMRLNRYRQELDEGLRSGNYTPEEAERYWRYAQDDPQGYLSGMFNRDKLNPRYEGSQTIFGDLADDYFELLVKPRRGLDIPVPEKLASSGHWGDPSVMVHIRGETVGPRAVVQEDQGDWNRIFREAQKFKQDPIYIPTLTRDDPAALDFIRNNRDALIELGLGRPAPGNKIVMDFNRLPKIEAGWYGPSGGQNQQGWFRAPTQEDAFAQLEKAREVFGNVPPLPPELSKAWPEVGAKAALAYAARDPNLQRVSFVDDLIAASARNLDPEKTQGIYGARLPQFLRKYVPKYGGEYYSEPGVSFANQRLTNDLGYDRIADRFLKLDELVPQESKLHTIELGDWNSPFRKFLRGQQPIAMVPLLAEALRQMQNSQNFQNPQEQNQVQP